MMKIIPALIFFLAPILANAQLQDDFGDGDFTQSPAWSGSPASFSINASGQLQLNAAASGTAYLSTPLLLTSLDRLEWRFFIRENFSPSSSNYGRVYLVSDQPDLTGPLNGYYLQFGESLSNDAVELFRQDGVGRASVCRAANGQIASPFSIGVKVTRDANGLWSIWVDPHGGTDYFPEASGTDLFYQHGTYFGISCVFTSSNQSNFFFDDFLVQELVPDTIAPVILSVVPADSSRLDVHFSEALDSLTAKDTSNYAVDPGIGTPQLAWPDASDLSLVHLFFANSFYPGALQTLSVAGLKDLSGNRITGTVTSAFIYHPPVPAAAHDIIFSEIMFEPSSSAGVPDAEYVELLNRSGREISLDGWTLSDGSSTATFPAVPVQPGQYLLVCSSANKNLFPPEDSVTGLSSFPGLNNDVGDHLILSDNSGKLIDETTFSDDTYRDPSKRGGGWSLERIDTSFLCPDAMNWKASVNPSGGTPGRVNSVNGNYRDRASPYPLRAFLEDSLHVNLLFSEAIDPSTALDPDNYFISSSPMNLFHPFQVHTGADDEFVALTLPGPADSDLYTIHISGALRDCPGNPADTTRAIRFGFPSDDDSGDVVINEILFHPQQGGYDFLEIYNRSSNIIDLKDWRVAEAKFENPDELLSVQPVTTDHFLFFPGDYIALTENKADLVARYPLSDPLFLFNVKDLPDFNSTEGAAVLFDKSGITMDRIVYSESMHFPLLVNTAGVSLERLSADLPAADPGNWHSASGNQGYATPGFQNSQRFDLSGEDDSFTLQPRIISPDGDGNHDVMEISFHHLEPGWDGTVIIYDLDGRVVRTLRDRQLTGSDWVILWDGTGEKREKVPVGIYIVYAQLFNLNGDTRTYKKACFLDNRD